MPTRSNESTGAAELVLTEGATTGSNIVGVMDGEDTGAGLIAGIVIFLIKFGMREAMPLSAGATRVLLENDSVRPIFS